MTQEVIRLARQAANRHAAPGHRYAAAEHYVRLLEHVSAALCQVTADGYAPSAAATDGRQRALAAELLFTCELYHCLRTATGDPLHQLIRQSAVKLGGDAQYLYHLSLLSAQKHHAEELTPQPAATGDAAAFPFYLFIYIGNLETRLRMLRPATWDSIKSRRDYDPDIICYYKTAGTFCCRTFGEVRQAARQRRRIRITQ